MNLAEEQQRWLLREGVLKRKGEDEGTHDMPCFRGAVWWRRGTHAGSTWFCTLLTVPDIHSPLTFFVHMLSIFL